MKKLFFMLLATAAIVTMFSSCSGSDDILDEDNFEYGISKGSYRMKMTVTGPQVHYMTYGFVAYNNKLENITISDNRGNKDASGSIFDEWEENEEKTVTATTDDNCQFIKGTLGISNDSSEEISMNLFVEIYFNNKKIKSDTKQIVIPAYLSCGVVYDIVAGFVDSNQ